MVTDVSALKTAVPYLKAYRGKVFVVKLGGNLCRADAVLDNICEQLDLLFQLGIKLVVVHGGGEQASELAEKLQVETPFVAGRRITSKEMLEVSKMSFAGTVNTNLIAALRKQGVPAVGLSGVDGKLITARKRPETKVVDGEQGELRSVDFGYVGDIVETDVELLKHTLAGGYMPVICCLAADDTGMVLNVNADTIGSRLAQDIQATKYIVLSTADGILHDLSDPSTLYSVLNDVELEALIADGVVREGMLPKATTSLEALRGGVPKVHIVNGLLGDSLLKEIFTNEGSGTLVMQERANS